MGTALHINTATDLRSGDPLDQASTRELSSQIQADFSDFRTRIAALGSEVVALIPAVFSLMDACDVAILDIDSMEMAPVTPLRLVSANHSDDGRSSDETDGVVLPFPDRHVAIDEDVWAV